MIWIVLLLILPLVAAVIFKKDLLFFIRATGVYVLLSITLLVLPYFKTISPTLYPLEALLYTMKSMLLNNDSTVAHYYADLDLPYAAFYTAVFYVFSVLSPLFTIGISLSLFEYRLKLLLYRISSIRRKSVIFNECNERTKYLGTFLRDQDKKMIIVYLSLNHRTVDNGFIKSIKAMVFEKNIHEIMHSTKQTRTAYLLSDNELNNIKDVMSLIEGIDQRVLFHDVHLTYHGETPKVILEAKYKEMHIHWLEEEMLVVEDLLSKHPLYRAVNTDKELNVMIVGLGKVGKELLKQTCHQSVIAADVKVRILALDLHATKVRDRLEHDAPLIFDRLNIEFFDVDVESSQFNRILKETSFRPTYLAICLAQQQLSIETAIYLRRHYERFEQTFRVQIHVAIDNPTTKTLLLDNLHEVYHHAKDDRGFEIQTFGIYKENYQRYLLDEPRMRLLCYLTHCLFRTSEQNVAKMSVKELKDLTKLDLKNTRAFVNHLPTKLFGLGFGVSFVATLPANQDDLEQKLGNQIKKQLRNLVELDGRRWQAFRKADGYTPLELCDIHDDRYCVIMKKQHARINLDDSRRLARAIHQPDDFFVKQDEAAVRSILALIRLYNAKIKDIDPNGLYLRLSRL